MRSVDDGALLVNREGGVESRLDDVDHPAAHTGGIKLTAR
jgi:hypothetical protein